jgi:hypothetical protein
MAQHPGRRKHQQRKQGIGERAQLAPEGRPARHTTRTRPRLAICHRGRRPFRARQKERRVSGALGELSYSKLIVPVDFIPGRLSKMDKQSSILEQYDHLLEH